MHHGGAMPDDGDAGPMAQVAGNRAGVVEWANDAFFQLTGIPLADMVNKPVTRFLERAGIELEVVDFVAQHFFEGRPCRLEFPFERPDGRRIQVLLDVEPLRDPDGEIDRFRARAVEQRAPGDAPRAPGIAWTPDLQSPESGALGGSAAGRESSLLHSAIRRVLAAERRGRRTGNPEIESWLLDLDLADEPLAICGPDDDLEAVIRELLQTAHASLHLAGQPWGTITLSTGRTTPNRRFLSKVHAIPAGLAERAASSRIYLEIHDNGEPLADRTLQALRRAGGPARDTRDTRDSGDLRDVREDKLGRAIAHARALGASIALDSTPGCGNQALVLFPD